MNPGNGNKGKSSDSQVRLPNADQMQKNPPKRNFWASVSSSSAVLSSREVTTAHLFTRYWRSYASCHLIRGEESGGRRKEAALGEMKVQ